MTTSITFVDNLLVVSNATTRIATGGTCKQHVLKFVKDILNQTDSKLETNDGNYASIYFSFVNQKLYAKVLEEDLEENLQDPEVPFSNLDINIKFGKVNNDSLKALIDGFYDKKSLEERLRNDRLNH